MVHIKKKILKKKIYEKRGFTDKCRGMNRVRASAQSAAGFPASRPEVRAVGVGLRRHPGVKSSPRDVEVRHFRYFFLSIHKRDTLFFRPVLLRYN